MLTDLASRAFLLGCLAGSDGSSLDFHRCLLVCSRSTGNQLLQLLSIYTPHWHFFIGLDEFVGILELVTLQFDLQAKALEQLTPSKQTLNEIKALFRGTLFEQEMEYKIHGQILVRVCLLCKHPIVG